MNKKMLGICLAAAVISTGTLGGVVASEVADRSLMLANAGVEETGVHMDLVEPSMFTPGNSVYIAVQYSDSTWKSENHNFYVRFSNNLGEAWSEPMTIVEGYDFRFDTNEAKNANIYETVVPTTTKDGKAVVSWDIAIAVSNENPAWPSDHGSYWENSWYQTCNVTFDASNPRNNLIQVRNINMQSHNGSDSNNRAVYTSEISPIDRLNVWGGTTGFWGDANNVCQADGSTDREQLAALWGNAELSFGKLGMDVQSYFSNFSTAEGLGSSQTNMQHLGSLAEKYDYLVRKYGFNDFAHRI